MMAFDVFRLIFGSAHIVLAVIIASVAVLDYAVDVVRARRLRRARRITEQTTAGRTQAQQGADAPRSPLVDRYREILDGPDDERGHGR